MQDFPDSEFIIYMDMNCNVYNSRHPFNEMLTDFISKNNFITALDLNDNIDIFKGPFVILVLKPLDLLLFS